MLLEKKTRRCCNTVELNKYPFLLWKKSNLKVLIVSKVATSITFETIKPKGIDQVMDVATLERYENSREKAK